MRPGDWLLFLLIGASSYAAGFFVSKSERALAFLSIERSIELNVLLDSATSLEQSLAALSASPAIRGHIRFKPMLVHSRDGFLEALPAAQLAIARTDWLVDSDRKPIPIYRFIPNIDRNIHSLFLRKEWRQSQIIPLLWAVPGSIGPTDSNWNSMIKTGVSSSWPFLPMEEFFGSSIALVKESKFKVGIWNQLVQLPIHDQKLLEPPKPIRGLVLGLLMLDTPRTSQAPVLDWIGNLLESADTLRSFVPSGLGLTWLPVERDQSHLVPEPQRADKAATFPLETFL